MIERPLPKISNEIFELIYYTAEFSEIENLFQTITDPIDQIHARFWILASYENYKNLKNKETYVDQCENAIDTVSDSLANFITKYSYYYFKGSLYLGYNNIDSVFFGEEYIEGKKYIEKAIEIYNQNEEVLKNSHPWFYWLFLAEIKMAKSSIAENDTEQELLLKESINAISNQPIDGSQLIFWYNIGLRDIYIRSGRFKEAEKINNILPKVQNYNVDMMVFIAKSRISFLRGNIDDAIANLSLALEKETMKAFPRLFNFKNGLARLYDQKGEFEKAKELLVESIIERKEEGEPIFILVGYAAIIRFLTNRYQTSSNPEYITEANEYLNEVDKLGSTQSNNFKVPDYVKACKAIVLKFGRLSDRLLAYEIFKDLLTKFPNNSIYISDLIELLIDEAKLISSNPDALQEIINELDSLIKRLASFGIFNSTNDNIIDYIQRQILLAKYDFYIKGRPDNAIRILEHSLKQLDAYNLPNLKMKVNKEIDNIITQTEILTSQTLQERLKNREFEDYMKYAIQMKDTL